MRADFFFCYEEYCALLHCVCVLNLFHCFFFHIFFFELNGNYLLMDDDFFPVVISLCVIVSKQESCIEELDFLLKKYLHLFLSFVLSISLRLVHTCVTTTRIFCVLILHFYIVFCFLSIVVVSLLFYLMSFSLS